MRLQRFANWLSRPFLRSHRLTRSGERIDIDLRRGIPDWSLLNANQRCHLRRYEFASAMAKSAVNILDVACGMGYGSILLGVNGANVLAVDLSHNVVAAACKRYKSFPNVTYQQGDIRCLDVSGRRFDIVISFETIEHLDASDIPDVLRSLRNVLTDQGRILISTPYRQKGTDAARIHHRTFGISPDVVRQWCAAAELKLMDHWYQSYRKPEISESYDSPDFLLALLGLR
ncbi:MAG: class I SAM-dependent methyltransferase [Phycisphaeraceae bacterium]|nr:class I SAM-dependent methyltransferase [Phycisphaeraceae bacterium]